MARGELYYRHRLPVRIMHWINVVAFVVMLMSGLMIFNAHPSLYWGKQSYGGAPRVLNIGAYRDEAGGLMGVTTVFGHSFDTTGWFGVSDNARGIAATYAFPHWLTIPSNYSLAVARRWHFFFMWLFIVNGLAYVIWSAASRHLSRDLAPSRRELGSIWQSVKDHVRFKHPKGEAARNYNVLQKLTYLSVIFVWLPLVIAMGFAMSPALNSLWPGWVDVFGGRQSARTLHFVAAFALLAFVALHVFLVVTTGVWNNMRSMISGRYRIGNRSTPMVEPVSKRRSRRGFLRLSMGALSAVAIAGCDKLGATPWFSKVLETGETLTRATQRLIVRLVMRWPRNSREADIVGTFRSNGTAHPRSAAIRRACGERIRRLAAARWMDSSHDRSSFRWPNSEPCRAARRSPATTASRGGAQSQSGPACRCTNCSRAWSRCPRRAMWYSIAPTRCRPTARSRITKVST